MDKGELITLKILIIICELFLFKSSKFSAFFLYILI